MVDTLTLVLVGVLAYTVGAMALQRWWGRFPSFLTVSGPITTVKTKRGRDFLERLARHRRFWRAFANVGVGFGLVVLAAMFLTVVFGGLRSLQRPESTPGFENPTNVLVIPGVNDFLPLAAAPEIVFGLAVAIIVHEGGHGLLCRAEDIDIDSMGLALLTVVPIGAFVEPDEDEQRDADRGAKTRMFAAGVTNNFVLTIIALALLFGPVAGSIQAVDGVAVGGVDPGSAADRAGVDAGDVITGFNDSSVTIDGEGTTDIESWLYVYGAAEDGPLSLSENDSIVAVNGTAVSFERGFLGALENRTVVTVRTGDGTETTGPIGALVGGVMEGGPLATANGELVGKSMVITRIDDRRIHNRSGLLSTLHAASPGDTVEVTGYVNGTATSEMVTLGSRNNGSTAFLGVTGVRAGYSGVVLSEVGIREYPSQWILGMLGGAMPGGSSPGLVEHTVTLMVLPFMALVNPNAFGFAGFFGTMTSFYTITGPLAFLGGGVFVLANLLFWTAWVNLNLAVFNLLPLFPLDGGHMLRTSAEAVFARTPLNRRWAVRAVTLSVGLLTLFGLLVMTFGKQLPL